MLTSFSHVMMYVNDISRAAKWYEDILGFKPVMLAAPHYGIMSHPQLNFRLDLHPDRQKNKVGGGAQVYFEYHEARGVLECSALVYRFNEPPRPGVIEGFEAEAREGTDTGGGSVDYERENRGLFLSREYAVMPEGAAFTRDMKRLAKASLVWGDEVLDRVASRVFHPEELEKR